MRIIAVGKLKTSFWKQSAGHYLERLRHTWQVDEINPRDADSSLPPAEAVKQEGAAIIAALRPNDLPVCLDEQGREFSSREFAAFLRSVSDHEGRQSFCPVFIIGGAFGLSDEVRGKARHIIALSRMTFPHELARVLLLEQLYRADSILRNSPYHH